MRQSFRGMSLPLVFFLVLAIGGIVSLIVGKLVGLVFPAAFLPASVLTFAGWIYLNLGNSS
jgi:NhaP-type Na+/H+ or K+/H+ antiporter